MVASVSMLDVTAYVLVVVAIAALLYCVTEIALGVMYAREYYRQHPEAVPPDRRLVRLGLRGVR